MKQLFLVFTFSAILLGASAQERDTLTERRILNLEREWVQLAVERNAEGFAALMAPAYVSLIATGQFINKRPWVDALRAGGTTYIYANIRDMKVYLYDKTAVVTGRYAQKTLAAGRETEDAGSYINTWTNVNGTWLLVSSAFTDDPRPTF